jgi:hypothetical protein
LRLLRARTREGSPRVRAEPNSLEISEDDEKEQGQEEGVGDDADESPGA